MNDLIVQDPTEHVVQIFNPLDASPVEFKQALVQRQENYDALAIHLRGMLMPGHDFGQIHVAGKKTCPAPWNCSAQVTPGHWSKNMLFAAGADKVLGILGLAVNYPGQQDIMRAALTGKPIVEVIIKCEIVDQRGQVIAEEFGACARREVNDSLNNAVKRAAKRARVGAVLRLPSISALFEADFLESVKKTAAENGQNSTAARSHQHHGESHNTGARLDCMPFGKHKDEKFSQLPEEYLLWITSKMADKPDIMTAAKRELDRRAKLPAAASEPSAGSQGSTEDLPPVDVYEEDFDDDIPF